MNYSHQCLTRSLPYIGNIVTLINCFGVTNSSIVKQIQIELSGFIIVFDQLVIIITVTPSIHQNYLSSSVGLFLPHTSHSYYLIIHCHAVNIW